MDWLSRFFTSLILFNGAPAISIWIDFERHFDYKFWNVLLQEKDYVEFDVISGEKNIIGIHLCASPVWNAIDICLEISMWSKEFGDENVGRYVIWYSTPEWINDDGRRGNWMHVIIVKYYIWLSCLLSHRIECDRHMSMWLITMSTFGNKQ